MRAALLCIALGFLAWTAPAGAQELPHRGSPPPSRAAYYIEFRARSDGILGHAYFTYGRLDRFGHPIDMRYAGLYPDDRYERALLTFGPLLVVPAFIGSENQDRGTHPSVIYRRPLTAEQFARLEFLLRWMRSNQPHWNLVFHSCNDFVGEVARELGLVIPLSWVSPSIFVSELRKLNER